MTTQLKKLVVFALALAIPSFTLADKIPTIAKTKVGMSFAEFKKVSKNVKSRDLPEDDAVYKKVGLKQYSFYVKGLPLGLAYFHKDKMIRYSSMWSCKSDAEFNAYTNRILEILGDKGRTHHNNKRTSWDLPQFSAELNVFSEQKPYLLSLTVVHKKLYNQMEKDAESKVDVGF